MHLGPRTVYLLQRSSGAEHIYNIALTIDYTHDASWIGDPTCYTGRVRVSGEDWETTVKVFAVDEVQAVGRLVELAGSILLGIAERSGRELRTLDRTEPVTDPMQLF